MNGSGVAWNNREDLDRLPKSPIISLFTTQLSEYCQG
jgi:hypothetical protein